MQKGKAKRASKDKEGAEARVNKEGLAGKGDRNIGEADEGKGKGRTIKHSEDRERSEHRRRREQYG